MAGLDVKVYVGGEQAQVTYAGRSGCCAGLDQVRFIVPDNVAGCYVPVTVVVEGVPSNSVTMSVSGAGASCSDPGGLTASAIEKARIDGNLSLGQIELLRTTSSIETPAGTLRTTVDSGSAVFQRYEDYQWIAAQPVGGLFQNGACYVHRYSGSSEEELGSQPWDNDPVEPHLLDAGVAINVNGPNGSRLLEKTGTGIYGATLGGRAAVPPYLSAGGYSFDNGIGGDGVGAFLTSAVFPEPVHWTNMGEIGNVQGGTPLRVTWSGGNSGDVVIVAGSSIDSTNGIGVTFLCQQAAAAGEFTVPAWVIDTLPPTSTVEGVPLGTLSVASIAPPARFDAPGLDVGLITWTSTESKQVGFRIPDIH
jgi:hypothetical protein